MKVKESFVCELCNTEYNNLDKANECEKFHAKPKKVFPLKYVSKFNDNCSAPLLVWVKMDDGEEYVYRRCKQ